MNGRNTIIKRGGRVRISKIEQKARELMKMGMFKRIDRDGPDVKKFRLLNTPYVLKLIKPLQQSEVELRWLRRGWETIADSKGIDRKILRETYVKFEEVIYSEKVPLLYRRKLLFRMGDFTGC